MNLSKAVASFTLLGGQHKNISSSFSVLLYFLSFFLQYFMIFFLILVVQLCDLPTQEGSDNATEPVCGLCIQSARNFEAPRCRFTKSLHPYDTGLVFLLRCIWTLKSSVLVFRLVCQSHSLIFELVCEVLRSTAQICKVLRSTWDKYIQVYLSQGLLRRIESLTKNSMEYIPILVDKMFQHISVCL